MRAFRNSLMVALVVMALFWGNCFSCPQILLAAQRHHCCPHGKSGGNDCQTQGLRNYVKAEQIAHIAPAIVVSHAAVFVFAPERLNTTPATSAPPEYTPPDLLPLRI